MKYLLCCIILSLPTSSIWAQSKASCLPEVIVSDHNGMYTRGNGDEILSPNEQMKVDLIFKNDSPDLFTAKITSAKNLIVVSNEKRTLDNDKVQYSYWITPKRLSKLTKQNKHVYIEMETDCLFNVQIPYHHLLADELELSNLNENDKRDLDIFIKNFPDSKLISLAFGQRMKNLSDAGYRASQEDEINQAIMEYDEFIDKYYDTVGAQLAINKEFDLYKKLDQINRYEQFRRKYPDSIQAHLANEHIKRKFYEQTKRSNSIEMYDKFIERFPYASPYVEDIIERSKIQFISGEINWLTKQQRQQPIDEDKLLEKRALQILQEWQSLVLSSDQSSPRLKQVRIERLLSLFSKDSLYNLTHAKAHLDTRTYVESKIKNALDELKLLVKNKHKEGQNLIIKSFDLMRSRLDKNFKGLTASLKEIELGLIKVTETQIQTNQRLDTLNAKVDDVKHNMNQRLDTLNAKVDDVKHNVNQRLDTLNAKVDDVKHNMNKKLNNLHTLVNQHMEKMQESSGKIDIDINIEVGGPLNWGLKLIKKGFNLFKKLI